MGDAVPTRVFDPCSPLQLVATSATDAQNAAIDAATASWAFLAVGRAQPAPDTLSVVFANAAPAVYGEYADAIYVNGALDPTSAAIVIAHELGHAFGLVHVPNDQRSSVMNPGNLVTPPTDADRASLVPMWGTCPVAP